MKSLKITATIALVSLGAIATGVKPASAQTGYDMWTDTTYDTSNCSGYSSCYVDGYGDVYGSNDAYDPGSYGYDDTTWYNQLY